MILQSEPYTILAGGMPGRPGPGLDPAGGDEIVPDTEDDEETEDDPS
jgi:hypothetical protein